MKIKDFKAFHYGVYALTEDGELYFKPTAGNSKWINIGEDIGRDDNTAIKIPIVEKI